MSTLRAFVLALGFLCLTLFGITVQYVSLGLKLRSARTFPQTYHRALSRLFGFRITVLGEPVQDRGVLMVANHTSYFDIIIMGAAAHVCFVARRDVNSWPLFGLMSRLQRSVFIERTRRHTTGEARDALRDRLCEGDAIVLFPEGTTTDGNRVIAFKSALMSAAETELGKDAAGNPLFAPVQPVSVSYVALYGVPLGRENRPLFAWYGDMELLPHLWEALKAGPLDVVVEFHPPLTVGPGRGRKELAALAEAVVREGQRRALGGLWSRPEPGLAADGKPQAAPAG